MSKASHNIESYEVFGVIKGIYNKTWHMEREIKSKKYKKSNSRIWEKDKHRSKTIREIR